ncbi:hypothetical protein SA2016_0983 [Sinomonas atrocyanea]|uniref:Uncharacterized protein n=1 Tax=Sinomonas atrocyanea TaxID=37927 RepID=A0A126ZWV9_9MICC|nr:hypothetical protein [Sinomonas atrocyanea]AMM31668.1 hypothetical protein SA2016_0983 [Sinomonas atrocyanea]GEB65345.1 hypothetical protein SAT01_27930 [Sinomonas atrocyanea]GGG59051.1 hypothetical protein GCM10007172_07410 [Sinomonas atrocyanea]
MTIIAESRSASSVTPAMTRLQEESDPVGREEHALRALTRAGMSRQTEREQIRRLAGGDIWSG